MTTTTGGHVPAEILDRYATEEGIGAPEVSWAVEVHLESCELCGERLGEAVARVNPAATRLLVRVRDELVAEVARDPGVPERRRRLRAWVATWMAPAVLPRLAMTLLVVAAAVGLDMADAHARSRYPSLVLLIAPLVPLLPVAAAWSRGLDPAYEMVSGSARAGLELVLRRTIAVLVVVIPVLGLGGWIVGASPARWLLPCLALTVGALALGEVVGLHRAATGLAAVWAVIGLAPSLVTARPTVLMAPASVPVWALLTVAVTVLLVVRRRAYTRLGSMR